MNEKMDNITSSISKVDYFSEVFLKEKKSISRKIFLKKIKKFFIGVFMRILSIAAFIGVPLGMAGAFWVSFKMFESGNIFIALFGFLLNFAAFTACIVAFPASCIFLIEADTPAFNIEVDEIQPLIESKEKFEKLIIDLGNASGKLEKVVAEESLDLNLLYSRQQYLENKTENVSDTKLLIMYKDLLTTYWHKIKDLEMKKQCEDSVQGFISNVYYDSLDNNTDLNNQVAVRSLKLK